MMTIFTNLGFLTGLFILAPIYKAISSPSLKRAMVMMLYGIMMLVVVALLSVNEGALDEVEDENKKNMAMANLRPRRLMNTKLWKRCHREL